MPQVAKCASLSRPRSKFQINLFERISLIASPFAFLFILNSDSPPILCCFSCNASLRSISNSSSLCPLPVYPPLISWHTRL